MYIIEERIYTDCEGYNTKWETTEGKFNTIKEAEEKAMATITKGFVNTGDWKIVARTIDEATFTVTEETVKTFVWWEEIGKFESAKKTIENFTKRINEIEASKKNCRTEKGIARKQKEIDEYKEDIEWAKKVLAEKK